MTMTTFALIPGAGGVSWYWHRVAPRLQAAGHAAIPIDLPGDDEAAGLPEYARLVADAIDGHDDVVLVAQSLGGFTAPLVAAAAPVHGIVLVNAMIPLPGETPDEWGERTGAPRAREEAARARGYDPQFDMAVYFLHDVPPEIVAAGEPYQRPESDAVFASKWDFDAWPAVPTRVVVGAEDRLFPVEFQRTVARERLGLEADVLPGGHLIALSQPAALARYLLAASPAWAVI
jgi:pimeloyl-ACP methyl ester carboxylesterase